jgi:hypothetical protein
VQGKDETFLCSLSNFDVYAITRVYKAPKSYVFALKSTDSLSFFEDASDYLHVFSCNEKEGAKWMQIILLARVCIVPRLVCRSRLNSFVSHTSYIRSVMFLLASPSPLPMLQVPVLVALARANVLPSRS